MEKKKRRVSAVFMSLVVGAAVVFGASQALAFSKPGFAGCPHQTGCAYGGYWNNGRLICCVEW